MNSSGTKKTFLFTSESVGEGHAGTVWTCGDMRGRVYPLTVTSANNSGLAVKFNSKSNLSDRLNTVLTLVLLSNF